MEIKTSISGKLRVYVLDGSKVPDATTAMDLMKKGELWKYILEQSECDINK